MTSVYIFPGQGSQHPGMGEEVFDLFPKHASQADALLGYSIRDLRLSNSNGVLNQTEFTYYKAGR